MKEVRKAAAESRTAHTNKIKAMAHSDAKEDRGLVKKMVKPNALTGRKHGGSTKKPSTAVNVVVAPKSGQAGPGGPSPVAPPPMAGPSGPMPPPPAGGLNAMRPPMAKRGGKVEHKRASGGSVKWLHAGAGSGEGRIEKEKAYGVKPKTRDRG